MEIALLGLLALLWGSSYLLAKVALAGIPPLTLVAVRVAIAALMLVAVMRWRRESLPAGQRAWRLLFVQSFFNSIAPWTVLAWGLQYVDSGLGGVLNSTSPLFVLLFALLLARGEAFDWRKAAGVACGFIGVVLVVGVDALGGLGRETAAQLAVLFGAALYAVAAMHGKHLAHLTPLATAAGTMIWATALLVPASLAVDAPWTLRPSPAELAAAAALGVACTGFALLLYFRLLRTLGPLGVTSQSYLRSGISVLLGVAILGERLSFLAAIGLAAIVLGVAAINYRGARA